MESKSAVSEALNSAQSYVAGCALDDYHGVERRLSAFSFETEKADLITDATSAALDNLCNLRDPRHRTCPCLACSVAGLAADAQPGPA